MSILAILRALLLIVTMSLYLLVYAISRTIWPHSKTSAFRLRRHWITYMCIPILNIKTEVQGRPIDGAALYVCNHRSYLDPVVISKHLDAFVIAKAEISDYPVINKGAEVTGVIWVKRDSRDSRAATRQAYIDTLAGGYNVLVYPEGTVSITPETLPFKRGTFNEAAKNGFTVVPVAIEYKDASDLWTVDGLLSYYIKQCSKWSISTKLTFGEPFHAEDGDFLHDASELWINEELARMQEGWSTAFTTDVSKPS